MVDSVGKLSGSCGSATVINSRALIDTRIDQAGGIGTIERPVSDISVKIDIAARETDRIFGDESSEIRIVPAGPVEMDSGEIVVLAAGEFVPGRKISRRVAE